MEQPKIKVKKPEQSPEQSNVINHDFNPSEPYTTTSKTVGNMSQDEFLELLVKGIVKANKASHTLNTMEDDQYELEEPTNVFGKLCRTTGDIGHGIVDIAEGVLRGGIDVVTFGKAKRR